MSSGFSVAIRRMVVAFVSMVLGWLLASPPAVARGVQPPTRPAVAGQDVQAAQTPPPLPPPQLAGRWDLNVQASDPPPSLDPQPVEGEGERGGGGRGGYGGRGYREGGRRDGKPESAAVRQALERALEAPRFLIIVQHPDSVHLTDDEGRVTTLRPDGTKVNEQQAGGTVERTTRWEGRTLVTSYKLSNGARVTQRMTKVFDGLQLEIATRIEGGQLRRPLEFRWVYDQSFQSAEGSERFFEITDL